MKEVENMTTKQKDITFGLLERGVFLGHNTHLVLDTEFVDLNKAFVYNLGYRIISPLGVVLCERDLVIKQVYENKALFATSYYANKKPLYTSKMKGRKARAISLGFAMRLLQADIKNYGVDMVWAYNAKADIHSIDFTTKFYNCVNPLGNNIFDIMVLAKQVFLKDDNYINFCQEHNMITAKGNCKISAESCYAYLTNNANYIEEHTALADSRIEAEILRYCMVMLGLLN